MTLSTEQTERLTRARSALTPARRAIIALALDLVASDDNTGEWKGKRGPIAEAGRRINGELSYECPDVAAILNAHAWIWGNGYANAQPTRDEYSERYYALLG